MHIQYITSAGLVKYQNISACSLPFPVRQRRIARNCASIQPSDAGRTNHETIKSSNSWNIFSIRGGIVHHFGCIGKLSTYVRLLNSFSSMTASNRSLFRPFGRRRPDKPLHAAIMSQNYSRPSAAQAAVALDNCRLESMKI